MFKDRQNGWVGLGKRDRSCICALVELVDTSSNLQTCAEEAEAWAAHPRTVRPPISVLRPRNGGSPDTPHLLDICMRGEEVMSCSHAVPNKEHWRVMV